MAAKEQAFDGRKIVLYIVAVLLVLLGVFAIDAGKNCEKALTVRSDLIDEFARSSSSEDSGDDFQDDTTISMTGLI